MRRVCLVKVQKKNGKIWSILRMCGGCSCIMDYMNCVSNGTIVECKKLGGNRMEDGDMSEKDGQNIGKVR